MILTQHGINSLSRSLSGDLLFHSDFSSYDVTSGIDIPIVGNTYEFIPNSNRQNVSKSSLVYAGVTRSCIEVTSISYQDNRISPTIAIAPASSNYVSVEFILNPLFNTTQSNNIGVSHSNTGFNLIFASSGITNQYAQKGIYVGTVNTGTGDATIEYTNDSVAILYLEGGSYATMNSKSLTYNTPIHIAMVYSYTDNRVYIFFDGVIASIVRMRSAFSREFKLKLRIRNQGSSFCLTDVKIWGSDRSNGLQTYPIS